MGVTCYMRSRSVTCHPTQVNTPRLNPSQTDWYSIDNKWRYGLLAAYIGGLAAQAGWLGPKVGGHLASLLYSSREPSELSQWMCSYDDSTINVVVIIIIIII